MWVVFDKFGKIIKSLDIDCPPARMGTTDFKIFAIFLDRDISDCSATITFQKPDYDKNKYYPLMMRSTTHKLTSSLLDKDAVDYAPLELDTEYEGFEFDFELDATGIILLDTYGEWKYTIDLYKGTLEKRYVYVALENANIDGESLYYELASVGENVELHIKANVGYKLPDKISISLDADKYTYVKTSRNEATLTILNINENVAVKINAKKLVEHIATFNLEHCESIDPITFDEDEEITVEIKPNLGYKLPSIILITGENDYEWSVDTTTRVGTLIFRAHQDVNCEIKAVATDYYILKIKCINHATLDDGTTEKLYSVRIGETQSVDLKTDGSAGMKLPVKDDTANFMVEPNSSKANIVAYVGGGVTATLQYTMTSVDTTITISGVFEL